LNGLQGGSRRDQECRTRQDHHHVKTRGT
jgi:hypothetical protein